PATVRVYRGARADEVTSALGADAITVGDEVAIATGHAEDAPEALGLLAHELTHVARARERGFVPPVVRPRPPRLMTPLTQWAHMAQMAGSEQHASAQYAPLYALNQGMTPEPVGEPLSFDALSADEPSSIDEETLALRTETRVTRAARAATRGAPEPEAEPG